MHRPLVQADLIPEGPLAYLGKCVVLFDEIPSTNAYLLEQAATLEDGTVVWAEYQSSGRGRQGRQWTAPRGSSILLSVLRFGPVDSRLAAQAGLFAALAVCEAVEPEIGNRAAIRWPNDIVVGARKLGGVLVETTPILGGAEAGGRRRGIVIGIGVNCLQQTGHFSGELAHCATSLELESPHAIDRAAVARHLLRCLDARLAVDPRDPATMVALREAWSARCADFGSRVRLVHDTNEYAGTIVDITTDGDLLVQLDTGERRRFEPSTTTRIE